MKSMIAPFQCVGGHIASTSDVSTIVRQKIINVLVTSKLERVALPLYGAGIRQLLFESIDELTEADFKLDALTELGDNITGLSLVDMRIVQTAESQADVTVYFRTPLSSVMATTFTVTMSELTEESPL